MMQFNYIIVFLSLNKNSKIAGFHKGKDITKTEKSRRRELFKMIKVTEKILTTFPNVTINLLRFAFILLQIVKTPLLIIVTHVKKYIIGIVAFVLAYFTLYFLHIKPSSTHLKESILAVILGTLLLEILSYAKNNYTKKQIRLFFEGTFVTIGFFLVVVGLFNTMSGKVEIGVSPYPLETVAAGAVVFLLGVMRSGLLLLNILFTLLLAKKG